MREIVSIKVIRDAAPNEPGRWLNLRPPIEVAPKATWIEQENLVKSLLEPGHHVVQFDVQDKEKSK